MNPDAAAPRRSSSGSSFHFSFGILPPDARRAIEAVYGYCRAVDDIVDARPIDRGRAARLLQDHREDLARCWTGEPDLPVLKELQWAVRQFGLPRAPLEEILDGVAMDLERSRYAAFEDLRQYCLRVASAVGIVCLSIFRCRDPRSRDYAVALGIALQLTNILRDLKPDAARGRIYIPQDEIAAFGCSEAALLRGERTPAFLDLMRHQAGRARRYFDEAARLLPDQDRPRLLAAEVMAAIYRRLLRRIEASGFRVFDRRLGVPRLTQIGLALQARVTGQVAR
jgi:phytoene synthase